MCACVTLRGLAWSSRPQARVFGSDSVPWPKGHDDLNLPGGIAIVRAAAGGAGQHVAVGCR